MERMKVFISHKQEDAIEAKNICDKLKELGVNAYLDVLDNILMTGKDLTEHIKKNLNKCTDILVVMSNKTKDSWWVPFEIGMAAQKDFPVVSYLLNNVSLPDYLEYWPALKKESDLDKYIKAKQDILSESSVERRHIFNSYNNKSETERFYDYLRKAL